MKLNVYCYYNTLGGFFGKPFLEVIAPEDFVAQLTQSMYGAKEDVLESLKEDDLYCLGVFDNVTGELVSSKEFLVHVGEIANKVLLTRKAVPGDTDVKED